MSATVWLTGCALLLSGLLTAAVRAAALRGRILDVPNERSSHTIVTPRGGGLAIVLVVSAATLLLTTLGLLSREMCMAVAGGGLAVALVGYFDDRRLVAPALRLAVHLAAASWALAWLGGLPPLRVGAQLVNLGWAGQVLAVVAIVWTLNLFNFMDGIDGLAACEAIFIAVGGTLLSLSAAPADGLALLALAFAAACAGFLWWNWAPAKIFLGDVGSGYLGYLIAVLALAAARHNPLAVWIWLILGAVFFVDATVTLVRRAARREQVHHAHRSHAYQRLARRWRSHRRVTLAVLGINVLWLVPCALLARGYPDYAAELVLVALAPLVVLACALGAGTEEPRGS